jgi:beta-glucosidase
MNRTGARTSTNRFVQLSVTTISTLLALSVIPFNIAQSDAISRSPTQLRNELRAGNWPRSNQQLLIKPEVEAFVTQLMSKMTLEEKVMQMVQANISAVSPQELREFNIGSIEAGGDSAPNNGDVHSPPAAWLALTDEYARAASEYKGADHRAIPIIFGVDAVHGHSHLGGATLFPHNVALGATHDAELLTRIGRITAQEVSATGIEWTFAPTLAVVRDTRWGRSYESYSEDPAIVASYSSAMIKGIQGEIGTKDFASPGHAIASAKHFLGDGGTEQGRDQFDNWSSVPEFIRVHAAGYLPAINAGALTVMASYNGWHGIKMHENDVLLTDVLKGRMGFNGFVIGDWNAHEEIPGCTRFDCPAAINAGVDMVMPPTDWRRFHATTVAHVKAGDIPMSRIDDAVRRILRVKALVGMFERPLPAQRVEAGHFETIGSAEHRAVAREAVRKSLVLLKNNNGVLPINPKQHILVAGSAADSISQQCGGWTIDWQGKHSTNADFPGATSIYTGIKSAVTAAGGQVELNIKGSYTTKPDVAIVVFGEQPYAEYQGDKETLEFASANSSELQLMRKLRAAKVPVVAVLLSGRTLWVNRELNAADAFVAAWLPGSEGAGIADVLLRKADGSINVDFTGKLSFSWPNTVMPVTFKNGDEPVGAVFARGYGLNYAIPSTVAKLSEARHAAADRHDASVLYADAHVIAPWSINVQDTLGGVRLTSTTQMSPAKTFSATREGNALLLNWNGSGRGAFLITGAGNDLQSQYNGQAIQVRLKVNQKPQQPVLLGMLCSLTFEETQAIKSGAMTPPADGGLMCKAPRAAFYEITPRLNAAAVNEPVTVTVPLSCFMKHGAILNNVLAPLALVTNGKLSVTLTDVRFVRSVSNECPSGFADPALTKSP